MYRFRLLVYNLDKQVFPVYDVSEISEVREEGFRFTRASFPKLTFIDQDFKLIDESSVKYEFTIIWEEQTVDLGYVEKIRGTFTKADCNFDRKNKSLEVTPETKDRYTSLLNNLDIEYDLLKFSPSTQTVRYEKSPILQLYVLGSNKITNILGNRVWEQECTIVNDHFDLVNDYNFGNDALKAFVAGVGEGLVPDVTGEYTDVFDGATTTNFERISDSKYRFISYGLKIAVGQLLFSGNDIDGYNGRHGFSVASTDLDDTDFGSVWTDGVRNYSYIGYYANEDIYCFRQEGSQLTYVPPTNGTLTHVSGATHTADINYSGNGSITGVRWRWAIYDNDTSAYVYLAPVQELLNDTPTYSKGATFTSRTSSSQVKILSSVIYSRILTGKETLTIEVSSGSFVTQNTREITEEDIIPIIENYNRVLPINLPESNFHITDNHSVNENNYGVFSDDAVHFGGEYFLPPTGVTGVIPVNLEQWTESSLWFEHSIPTNSITDSINIEIIELRHAYRLSTVIDTLLQQIDNTLTHSNTSAYSDFFYGAANAIRGTQRDVFITPKSNIITANYDQPATRAEIKFNDIIELLKNLYNCYIDIDEDNKLIIEFVDYFDRGRRYSGYNYGVDLKAITIPRVNKVVTEIAEEYSYDKQDIPEYIQFEFMDETSDDFDGDYIICNDAFSNEGQVEIKSISRFTSDIDYILVNANEISKDGFVIMEAELSNGVYSVSKPNVNGKILQNGYLSIPYISQNLFIFDAPTEVLTINGVSHDISTDGGSIKKTKTQEITIPSNIHIDTRRLIVTSLGNGLVIEKGEKTDSSGIRLKFLHDTQL